MTMAAPDKVIVVYGSKAISVDEALASLEVKP